MAHLGFDDNRVTFYDATSFHARPGFWKYSEKLSMMLVEVELTPLDSSDSFVGRLPRGLVPSGLPHDVFEFQGLNCPVPFDRCFVLTTPPSKLPILKMGLASPKRDSAPRPASK